jgi:hypothetical protein
MRQVASEAQKVVISQNIFGRQKEGRILLCF